MEIIKCINGYIMKSGEDRYIATDIQELFNYILKIFENKSAIGSGNKYGKVTITYDDCDED